MYDDMEHQTAHSAKSLHLKTTFDAAVKDLFTDYTVDLTPPEETTGGGVRARQHIRLTAKDGRVVVIGSANASDGTADLRTLGCTLEVSKQRFGTELSIPGPQYVAFLERATDLFTSVFNMKVGVISTVSTSKAPPAV